MGGRREGQLRVLKSQLCAAGWLSPSHSLPEDYCKHGENAKGPSSSHAHWNRQGEEPGPPCSEETTPFSSETHTPPCSQDHRPGSVCLKGGSVTGDRTFHDEGPESKVPLIPPLPHLTLATSVHITFSLPSVVGISMETAHPSPSSGPIALACQECRGSRIQTRGCPASSDIFQYYLCFHAGVGVASGCTLELEL